MALFRYQVICPALEEGLSKAQRRVVRQLVTQVFDHPLTGPRKYSRESVDRWIRAYRKGGFDALVPAVAKPSPRTDTSVPGSSGGLESGEPDRTAAQVRRILLSSTGWSPFRIHVAAPLPRSGPHDPNRQETREVFGRFER